MPRPSPGRVSDYHAPGGLGVRVDTHIYDQYVVPPYYDSLLAKLVVWGEDREQAIARGRTALDELVIDGVVTNIAFHRALISHPTFLEGEFTTNLLDRVGSRAFLEAASAA